MFSHDGSCARASHTHGHCPQWLHPILPSAGSLYCWRTSVTDSTCLREPPSEPYGKALGGGLDSPVGTLSVPIPQIYTSLTVKMQTQAELLGSVVRALPDAREPSGRYFQSGLHSGASGGKELRLSEPRFTNKFSLSKRVKGFTVDLGSLSMGSHHPSKPLNSSSRDGSQDSSRRLLSRLLCVTSHSSAFLLPPPFLCPHFPPAPPPSGLQSPGCAPAITQTCDRRAMKLRI
ncbi:hypothetical protein CB1_001402097 [Camelus ferus]|nr:hypothetical protein CB1_001402097 [Camelus ferus]